MPIVLTADDRRAISRRLVKLSTEISIFDETIANADDTKNAYDKVDTSNAQFLIYWRDIADAYLEERRWMTGENYDTFTNSDITNLTTNWPTDPTNKFFPSGYNYLIPEVNVYTAGQFVDYASNCEDYHYHTWYRLFEVLRYGFRSNDPAVTSPTISSASTYNGGSTLEVSDASEILQRQIIYLQGSHSAVGGYYLLYVHSINIATNELTVVPMAQSGSTIIDASGAITISSAPIWTDVQRQNLAGSGIETPLALLIINYLTTSLVNPTGGYRICLDSQTAAINSNEDTRTSPAARLLANKNNIVTFLAGYALWAALPNTGVGCKYTNAGMAIFNPYLAARQIELYARAINPLNELLTDMGLVTPGTSGLMGTFTAVEGAVAYKYQWLDRRFNKVYGSYAQQDNMNITKVVMDQQKSNAEGAKSNYETVIRAVPLSANPNGSKSVYIDDITGWSVGDHVYITDDYITSRTPSITYQSELPAVILGIYRDGRIDLDIEVPSTYTTSYLVRLYKEV